MTTPIIAAGSPKAAGGAWFAPTGTALPEDVNDTLNAAFTEPYIVSPDGVSRSIDTETEDWKQWGGGVIRKISKGKTVTYEMEVIGISFEAMKSIFGPAAVTKLASGTIRIAQITADAPVQSFVLDMLDGDTVIREIIARGQVIVSGEVTYNQDAPIGFPITITALDPGNGEMGVTLVGTKAAA